ncbi:MAG: class E sortase [Oscillospiraceae bacterium]|nr:class E sortase [Oscillospiraceae bacterium]
MDKNNKAAKIIRAASTVFLVIGVGVMVFLLYRHYQKPAPPAPASSTEEVSREELVSSEPERTLELHIPLYPVGGYGPDEERKAYVDGSMTLRIPRLDFEGPVLNGVDDETLKDGVGLFDQAQLPGPENRNVSIAGHRDIYGMEFYYIDTIKEGDFLYLAYEGKEYQYEYEETFVTHPRDWDPVAVKDYSRITLQSCTPINVASDRIFVTGRLVDIRDIE